MMPITLGDIRRLPYPDETPVVVIAPDGFAYAGAAGASVVVACPGDLRLRWYATDNLRARGLVAEHVVFVR